MSTFIKRQFYDFFLCQGGINIRATNTGVSLNVANQIIENYVSWRNVLSRSETFVTPIWNICVGICSVATLFDVIILLQLFSLLFYFRRHKDEDVVSTALLSYERSEWLEYLSESFRVALAIIF